MIRRWTLAGRLVTDDTSKIMWSLWKFMNHPVAKSVKGDTKLKPERPGLWFPDSLTKEKKRALGTPVPADVQVAARLRARN